MAHKKDHLRVGAAERDKVIGIIGEHYSLGRLTEDEFQARMVAASDAKTRGDLRALTADLPKLPAVPAHQEDVWPDRFRPHLRWYFWAILYLSVAALLWYGALASHG